ncbi:MAG: ATP-dependent protease subunit HslV [Acidobacteria bacterium]|nr:ATP-dependent protease subunit HslV [Acidobacteriota bacterium]
MVYDNKAASPANLRQSEFWDIFEEGEVWLLNTRAPSRPRRPEIRATTVLCVRRDDKVVMAGDGQVTLADNVIKHTARKIRRLYNDRILAGFAGTTGDAFALFSRFESKLEQFNGNLSRAAVELAKDWRTDRALRHLEALLLVADGKFTFLLSGQGDIIEPDDGLAAIGSGGPVALAAARALLNHTSFPARQIAMEALEIAGKICIYTNSHITLEEL